MYPLFISLILVYAREDPSMGGYLYSRPTLTILIWKILPYQHRSLAPQDASY
jgi:hypothetical protein